MKFCIPILLSTLLVFCSCDKPDVPNDNPPGGGDLTSFKVTVLDRTVSQARIVWTEALNFVSLDTVKYKVTLNDRVVVSNLTRRNDTLLNLSGDSAYAGKVWAYTRSGDTSSATFMLDKVQEYIAINGQHYFSMYNLSSGVRMWSYGWNGVSNSSATPTIMGDTVFFCNAYSSAKKLIAYNFKTGTEIWSALPYLGPPSDLATSTNPLYHNGILIVATTSAIYALSSATGLPVWSKSIAFNSNVSAPVIDNNKIFISSGNSLMALNESNGNLLWSFPIEAINDRLLCMNNLLVFGTRGKIYALNQATGGIVWEKNFNTQNNTYDTYQEPFLLIDNVIISFVSGLGFYGINPSNGATLWYNQTDWMNYTAMTKGNGKVFYLDFDRNKVVSLYPKTGVLNWEVDSQTYGSFIFAKNKLYCSEDWDLMDVLDAGTGQLLKNINFKFQSTSSSKFSLRINDSSYYQNTHANFR